MPSEPDDLAEIVADHRIRRCIAALARGEDRRDADIIRGCFWSDASVNFGIFVGSFDEYLAWVVPGAPSIRVTLHTLGQSLIRHEGADMAAAVVESHVTAYHRVDYGEADHDLFLGGRYLDQMERRGDEWRIARRTMIYDWSQDMGASADFSGGLMGMPFLRGHPVGRAQGDMSEAFFG